LQQEFQDEICMVVKEGQHDIFFTLTTNPYWPETRSSLLPGQAPNNRPNIIGGVFYLKGKEIISDTIDRQIFKVAAGFSYTIVFQKRGMPDMHLLVILKDPEKLHGNITEIDKTVCAELPKK
jgi:Helitron helicase-like domain at N-terminus